MTEDTKAPSLTRLSKLIAMATSANDGEALVALRMANKEADKFGGWQRILAKQITVIGDPFADLQAPVARTSVRASEPSPYVPPTPRPRPQPTRTPYTNIYQNPTSPAPTARPATVGPTPTHTPPTARQIAYALDLLKKIHVPRLGIVSIPISAKYGLQVGISVERAVESLSKTSCTVLIDALVAAQRAKSAPATQIDINSALNSL